MNSSPIESHTSRVRHISVAEDALTVDLDDGRTISVPLAWFPRLLYGTLNERADWRLIGNGEGINWSQLDEDISLQGLLAGHPSGESHSSLKRWLQARPAGDAGSS